MYGLEAIAQHNGWVQSILGISIVFSGLVLLSFAVSQIHKILDLWDNREIYIQRYKDRQKEEELKEEDGMEDKRGETSYGT